MLRRAALGQIAFEPIPAIADHDRGAIAVGQILGVPAPEVPGLPARWIAAAHLESAVRARREQSRS